MCVWDTIGAVETWPCRRARTDGFIILVGVVAKGEVVHGALRVGHGAQSCEDGIGDMLGGFHVASHNGCGVAWAEHAAVQNDDPDGFQTAGIHRDVAFNHHAEAIKNCGACHRFPGALKLLGFDARCAREVDGCLALGFVDRDFDMDDGTLIRMIFIFGILESLNDAPDAFLGVVLHIVHVGLDHIEAEVGNHLAGLPECLFRWLRSGRKGLRYSDVDCEPGRRDL